MAIASEPKDKNVFKIENYDGLTEILEILQRQIHKMEGDVFLGFFFLPLCTIMLQTSILSSWCAHAIVT